MGIAMFQKCFHIFCVILVLLCALLVGVQLYLAHTRCIDFSALERYDPGTPSIVLDDEGNEWARFALDRREPVPLAQMPQHLLNAFVAAEDRAFFSHSGLSLRGIARSLLVNLYHGKRVQGASTITQQLVRLLFFDAKKTLRRKIKEQAVALLVERQFTKEQILQTYLNHVYFGAGIYGVEAAAQRFWGVSVGDLSPGQAATLAAIVKSPSRYCPLYFPLCAQQRRNLILRLMFEQGYLDEAMYEQEREQQLQLNPPERTLMAPHALETIRLFMEDLLGKQNVYTGGYRIQTTLNRQTQEAAQEYFVQHLQKLRKRFGQTLEGALLSIDVGSGSMKALVGGVDFGTSQFNRALSAKRQMGSIFKPVVYAAAIKQGRTFAETEVDEPFEFEMHGNVWTPRNSTKTFEGAMTLARALSFSNNIVTIKTLLQTGIEPVCDLAQAMRLPEPEPYPSIALGCVDATLDQVVGMFNVFANHGVYVKPYLIEWVKDRMHKKVWRHRAIIERVLPAYVSDQVTKILGIGIRRFSGYLGASAIDSEAIGKTGTTNDSRTCWFEGSTPTHTTAIYIGHDDNRGLGDNVFAVRTAFPIWHRLHKRIGCVQKQFVYDPSLREMHINWWTGEQDSRTAHGDVHPILI